MTTWNDHVFPHGPLTQIAPKLWVVQGRLPRGPLPRTMIVHLLSGPGGRPRLLIHSAVALDADGMKQLEALGEPAVMIVPNRFHRLDAAVFKHRYPHLKVLCPDAARKFVEQKVAVDGSCEAELPAWGVTCHRPPGIRDGELCYELDVGDGRSKALVVTDVLFNLPHLPGFSGWLLRLLGSSGFFGITRIGKFLLLENREAFRNWLHALSRRGDLQHICVGHGDVVSANIAAKLHEAARRV